jgi:hypothetical protein
VLKNRLAITVFALAASVLLFAACSNDDGGATGSGGDADDDPRVFATTATMDINVWDDTENEPPGRVRIEVPGEEPWAPDLEPGAAVQTFESFPIEGGGSFSVYPDGPEGSEIVVEFDDPEVLGESEDPEITFVVYIEDDQVIVNSHLFEEDLTFDREPAS